MIVSRFARAVPEESQGEALPLPCRLLVPESQSGGDRRSSSVGSLGGAHVPVGLGRTSVALSRGGAYCALEVRQRFVEQADEPIEMGSGVPVADDTEVEPAVGAGEGDAQSLSG